MRGIPEFNFPTFNAAADMLREEGHTVFNPAERDNERHGKDISKGNATGDETVAAEQHGFNLREALADDMAFITREADAIYMLAGWSKSRGARAERATAQALGLEVWYANDAEHIDTPAPAPAPLLAPVVRRLLEADSATRKTMPVTSGVLDYFPDAIAEVATVSWHGNEKHNPGQPLHWARGKSMDHADCIGRHLIERGGFDGPIRHSAALAWRALALLQEELEAEKGLSAPRNARDAA